MYKGGTVCDDGFGSDEAHVICQEMGYGRATSWASGSDWLDHDVQRKLSVKLDNVDCDHDGERWSSCTYTTSHDCSHSEDVFLTCVEGKASVSCVNMLGTTFNHGKLKCVFNNLYIFIGRFCS